MNRKDLDALNELYLSVYVWEDVENWVNSLIEEGYDLSDYTWEEMYESYIEEAPARNYGDPNVDRYNQAVAQSIRDRATRSTAQKQVQTALGQGRGIDVRGATTGAAQGRGFGAVSGGRQGIVVNKPLKPGETQQINVGGRTLFPAQSGNRTVYLPSKEAKPATPLFPASSRSRGSEVNPPSAADAKKDEADPRRIPTRTPVPGTPPTRTPVPGTPPRPAAASGPVLSKKDGVEGTGVGADFKKRAFTAAEKSRYASVAAQNAARTSTSSATPTKPIPSNASSATASTADKIKGGMNVYNKQITDKDTKGATETGKNISSLKFGSPEERKAKTIGTRNPLMDKTFGYQTGNSPRDQQARADDIIKGGGVAVLKPATSTPARNGFGVSAAPIVAKSSVSSATAPANTINNKKPITPVNQANSYEWPSAKTIRDIAGAYASIYEAKKKVDQNQDGENNFADVRIARMIASGMTKAQAIAMVKDKSYNEEVELWVNELLEEGYDLSEYTWEDMFEIYLDEATRMRKELGQEGEIATRKELAARSNAYQRSGSVDRTIAAAERGAENPYVVRGKNETEAKHNERKQAKSQTLTRLASNRRGSVRDKPRAGLRGYAAKVEGSDRDLQSARSSAMAAGTLTPREKKELNREAYAAYEFVASYLLENNFASTVDDANVIINNMSEGWFDQIMEAPYTGRPVGREAMLSNNISRARPTPTTQTTPRPTPTPTSTSQGPGTLEKVGSTLGAKVGGFIGQNRGTSTGIPGAGTIGRVIGSNKGSNIGGTVGRAADKVVGSFSQSSSGGYSTREGDGKPYKDGPLWDGGGPKTSPKPPKPTSKPPMRDEPLF